MSEDAFKYIIGCCVGIVFTLFFFMFKFNNWADNINIFGIIVNSFVLIFIVTIYNKNISNSRALKDFYIIEIKENRDLYLKFLDDIQSNSIKKQELTTNFKKFSENFSQLKIFVKSNFNFESSIQDCNRNIHFTLSDNAYFDVLKHDQVFEIRHIDKRKFEKNLKEFKFVIFNLINQVQAY